MIHLPTHWALAHLLIILITSVACVHCTVAQSRPSDTESEADRSRSYGSLSCIVAGPSGAGVADASVEVLQAIDSNQVGQPRYTRVLVGRTNTEGCWRCGGLLATSTYYLRAYHGSFGARIVADVRVAGGADHTVTIELRGRTSIVGTVSLPGTANGVSGAEIFLVDRTVTPADREPLPHSSAVTDNMGRFTISHIPAGIFGLYCKATGRPRTKELPVRVSDGIGSLTVNHILEPGAPVYLCIADDTGSIVDGAAVTAMVTEPCSGYYRGSVVDSAISDSVGNAVISVPRNCSISVRALKKECVSDPIPVDVARTPAPLTLRLRKAVRVPFRLIDAHTGIMLPCAEAWIARTSDFAGSFLSRQELVKSPSGEWTVEVDAERRDVHLFGRAAGYAVGFATIDPSKHQKGTIFTLPLERGSRIRGRVVDRSGSAVRRARVEAILGYEVVAGSNLLDEMVGRVACRERVESGRSGEFAIHGLNGGWYRLAVSSAGHAQLRTERFWLECGKSILREPDVVGSEGRLIVRARTKQGHFAGDSGIGLQLPNTLLPTERLFRVPSDGQLVIPELAGGSYCIYSVARPGDYLCPLGPPGLGEYWTVNLSEGEVRVLDLRVE